MEKKAKVGIIRRLIRVAILVFIELERQSVEDEAREGKSSNGER